MSEFDLDAALSDEPAEIVADAPQEPTPQSEIVEQPAAEPVADVKAEKPAPDAPKAEAEQPEPQDPEPAASNDGTIAYGAYKGEKTKRQELEAQLAAERAEKDRIAAEKAALAYQQQQWQAQQKPVEIPDPVMEPEKYQQHIQQTQNQSAMALRREIAELRFAQAGKPDAVKNADAWFDTLPQAQKQAVWMKANASPDPFGTLVSEYETTQLQAEIGGDVDAYKQKVIAEYLASQGQVQPQPAQVNTQQVKPKPVFSPSLAGVQSQGGRSAAPLPTTFDLGAIFTT